MTPTSSATFTTVALAFGCQLVAPSGEASTNAIWTATGVRADATSSVAPPVPQLLEELRRKERRERVRGLRGKYKGLLPSVDEYLRLKRADVD